MDAFFSGLDSRLGAAVKVADSIMVGLVNTAMEDAYRKSLWKDGDLERLFQKLRFAELAVMQLEWCLRFVRGEMDADGGGAADDGNEQLLDDLLETRDQIQARLDEAEQAVAQTDCDYMRRKRDDLDPARRREAPSAVGRRGAAEVEGGAFAELRGSVSRKMTRMRARLEDASSELAALMQKVSGEASPMARLQEPGHEGDGVKGASAFYTMAQLLMEFQEMVLDAGVVRDSVASAFDAMERSVSAQREDMDEQRWLMDAETEMYRAVVEGFLREINVESTKYNHSEGEGCTTPTMHNGEGTIENSSDEFQSLKDETSQLHSASARCIPADKSESRLCCDSEEKRFSFSQEEAERLTERTMDSEIRCELQQVLYSAVFKDQLRKLSDQAYDAQNLTEQRDEMEIRSNLQYEIHSIMFAGLVKNLGVESVDHLIMTSIEDEVHVALFAKIMNAWQITTEMVHCERLIKEEIDHIIFGGLINDLVNGQDLSVVKYQHQNRPMRTSVMINNAEQLEKGNIQVNVTAEDEDVGSNQHRALVDQEVLVTIDNGDRQNPRGSDEQAEESTYGDDVYASGNSNFEEGLDDPRKLQTEEVGIGSCMPSEGVNQEMCILLAIIYEMFMDFEAMSCGKIGTAVLRLRELDKQLLNLTEQVNSLKTSELIYRRAFTGRCCDLQTAEAEVDLLGDEVDLLLGLLSKTYRALDHYSPVLQHYVGIREMTTLLGKELALRLSH